MRGSGAQTPGRCPRAAGGGLCSSSWRVSEQYDSLTVQAWQLQDRAEELTAIEVEGDHVLLADAVEAPIRREPDPARFAKAERDVRSEHARERSCGGVVLAQRGAGFWVSEGMLAGNHDVAVARDLG
jgi:hypothetical protein